MHRNYAKDSCKMSAKCMQNSSVWLRNNKLRTFYDRFLFTFPSQLLSRISPWHCLHFSTALDHLYLCARFLLLTICWNLMQLNRSQFSNHYQWTKMSQGKVGSQNRNSKCFEIMGNHKSAGKWQTIKTSLKKKKIENFILIQNKPLDVNGKL